MSTTSTGGMADAEPSTVKIAWAGPEGKPLPSALLVSSPREGAEGEGHGEGAVVISAEEFRRLTEEVRAVGRDCAKGSYVSDEPQYFVQVEEGGEIWNCGLGFGRPTIEALERMAGALDERGARAVMDVASALERFVNKREDDQT